MTGLIPFLPDVLLLLSAFLVLGADLTGSVRATPGAAAPSLRPEGGAAFHLAWIGLAAVLACQVLLPDGAASATLGGAAFGGYGTSRHVDLWKQVFAASALGAVLLSRPYFRAGGNARGALDRPGAFYGLLLLCAVGMFALASARDLLVFYLGLELATLPLYALAAFQPRDAASAEAGSKFVIFGGLSSALTLFGLSFLYGAGGGLGLDTLAAVAEAETGNPILLAGVFFLLGGIGFKLAMAPLHMWAPDVYEGAPTPVMAFLSVGSKAAAVAALALLLLGPLEPLGRRLDGVLMAAAALSMTLGNLGAFRQRNLRRLVAYSAVAQAGYMLVAFAGNGDAVRVALLHNLAVYGVTSFALYFVMSVAGRSAPETLEGLRGLSRRSPALAALLALALFSLAGIPPLAGFLGKFLLFSAAAAEGHYVLVGIALANAVASFYYCMLPVKAAWLEAAPEESSAPLALSAGERAWAAVLAALLVVLGVVPSLVDYLSLR